MNPWAIPSLIAGVVFACLGAYLLYKNPKKSLSRLFSLLMLLCAVWSFGEFASRISSESAQALMWIKILNTALLFLGPGALHFALVFTEQKKMLQSKLLLPILYGIGFMFLYFVWATDLFVKGIWRAYWGLMDVHGPMFPIQSMYLMICTFIAMILFFYAYFKAVEFREKKRKLYALTGALIPLIGGVVVNLLFPIFFGFEIVPLATLFFACGGVFFAYAILKYKLFIIEPTAEEPITAPQKYLLEKGLSYIVKEEKLDKSYEIFYDQVTHGSSGVVITKLPPEKVREKYKITKSPILWLSFKEVENAVSPKDTEKLKSAVLDFVGKAEKPVVLIDCFDQIMLANGFEKAISMLREMNELCMKNNANLLVSVNPQMFEKEQLAAIEKEMSEVIS